MKKIVFLFIQILLLTGCTATYNLEISPEGFKENITIYSTSISENDLFSEIPLGAYYDVKENDENPLIKFDGYEYYDSTLTTDNNNLKNINYSYSFDFSNFLRASSIANTFENFIMKQYDHDEDGIDDYILISSGNDFNRFENNDILEKVTINITNNYEVISSNADKVDKNVYTWYLTKDNIKAINMVYNPDEVVDYRTLWEKF